MPRLKNLRQTAGIFILSGIILLAFANCKSPNSPDDTFEAHITIENDCGATLDIFLNGILIFSLDQGLNGTIEDQSQGTHSLEAKLTGTEVLVASETFEIITRGNYTWTVEGPASIVVNNEYGETLQIFGNGALLGDIDDKNNVTITNVRYGKYIFEASKLSDNTLVATTTIDVTEIKEYTWTISPTTK